MTEQKLEIWKTPTARAKLKDIYTYSCREWGKVQARKYMLAIEETIESVAQGIKLTNINPDFSTRFPYCTSGRHYIFFEYQKDKLIVVSLFHKIMSIKDTHCRRNT